MKQIIITLTAITAIQLASAQERVTRDEALRYAAAAGADAKQLKGTPIATDVDLQQPVALRDGEYGGLVLPDKKLSLDALAQAGDQVLPIGQLWLHKLTPMKNGEPVSADRLRLANVNLEGDYATVPQCTLGVRRNPAGTLELLVFGKGPEPVLSTPLKPVDTKAPSPIDLQAERDSFAAQVTLTLLGKYQAQLSVTEMAL